MGGLLAFKPLISPYFWVVIIGSQRICCASQCGLAKETIWGTPHVSERNTHQTIQTKLQFDSTGKHGNE
jgi:hypothetical protein